MRGLHQVGDDGGCVFHAGTVASRERDGGDASAIRSAVWNKIALLLSNRL